MGFLRGLMCGVCDSSSNLYLSTKTFHIDDTQCWEYMDACQYQLKATTVFLNYVKTFAALGSCKKKGIVEDAAEKPYISIQDQNVLDHCLQTPKTNYCRETCSKFMPFTGITRM